MLRYLGAACIAAAFLGIATPAHTQTLQAPVQSPVLTVDSDRLYAESAFGRQTSREIEALGAILSEENRRIEEELVAEEQALTDQRASMEPADFRDLADAFDAKVQEIRRQQDAKTRELNQLLEERQVAFLNAAAPILQQLMREAGAAVILERRSIFLSANAVDITQLAINRLNAAGITVPDTTQP